MILYSLFEIIGILVAAVVAYYLKMPKPNKKTRTDVYISGLIGLLIGIKLPVILSYGLSQDMIFHGKSYMGGILGAFIGINLYKYFTDKTSASFGGRYVIPLAIAAGYGKIGCYFNGCCSGHFFIPVQLFESGFQFVMAFLLYLFYKKTTRIDLLFPIYLLSYLIMRFLIEFVRIEPKIIFNLTIYQLLSLIFIPIIACIIWRRKNA